MLRKIMLAGLVVAFTGGAAFAQESCDTKAVGKDGKPTRVGFKIHADGKKVRIAKRSGAEIDG